MVTTGRRYWAASTCAIIGHGLKELTPDLLGDLSALLDVPAADLATLTGITPAPADVDGLAPERQPVLGGVVDAPDRARSQ